MQEYPKFYNMFPRQVKTIIISIIFCMLFRLVGGEHCKQAVSPVLIADKNQIKLSIIVSSTAAKRTVQAAGLLQTILSQMIERKFQQTTNESGKGIFVGTPADFKNLPFKIKFDVVDPFEKQAYELCAQNGCIYILGATPEAVQYAVGDFLYRLGCRFYFPMKKYWKIPRAEKLSFAAAIKESPDFATRMIWPGGSYKPVFMKSAKRWMSLNRLPGYGIIASHIYGKIISENRDRFKKHPEYYSLINNKRFVDRHISKFCISNPDLQKLVVNHVLDKFNRNPALESYSVEPSDGDNWCECEACVKMGTPSTRAIFLGNLVAKAVSNKFKGKRLGIYAYNTHSAPPAIDVAPSIIVFVATRFIHGGYTFEQLVKAWGRKASTLGVRDYLAVIQWSWDLPGRGMQAGDSEYLTKKLPEYYKNKIRYYIGESNDAWALGGLGNYLTARILWNINESKNVDKLTDEFLLDMFGPAAPQMKQFYDLIDGRNKRKMSGDLLARMYKTLLAARESASGNEAVMSRLDDFVLYTVYCEKCYSYLSATPKERQAKFDDFLTFAARIAYTRMVHSYGLWRRFVFNPSGIRISAGKKLDWDNEVPVNRKEIDAMLQAGIKQNKMLDFTPVTYSDELRPAPKLATQGKNKYAYRGQRFRKVYYTWVGEDKNPLKFKLKTGQIVAYRKKYGPIVFKLYNVGGASADGSRESLEVTDKSTESDGNNATVVLQPKNTGLYKIEVDDRGCWTTLKLCKGKFVILSDGSLPHGLSGNFYFYVPKGTGKIGMFHNLTRGQIRDPDGKNRL